MGDPATKVGAKITELKALAKALNAQIESLESELGDEPKPVVARETPTEAFAKVARRRARKRARR